eukprot:354887-Chlamydomonas_euryale.AAC.6
MAATEPEACSMVSFNAIASGVTGLSAAAAAAAQPDAPLRPRPRPATLTPLRWAQERPTRLLA